MSSNEQMQPHSNSEGTNAIKVNNQRILQPGEASNSVSTTFRVGATSDGNSVVRSAGAQNVTQSCPPPTSISTNSSSAAVVSNNVQVSNLPSQPVTAVGAVKGAQPGMANGGGGLGQDRKLDKEPVASAPSTNATAITTNVGNQSTMKDMQAQQPHQPQGFAKPQASADPGWSVPNPLALLGGNTTPGSQQGSSQVVRPQGTVPSGNAVNNNRYQPPAGSLSGSALGHFRTKMLGTSLIAGTAPVQMQSNAPSATSVSQNSMPQNQVRIPTEGQVNQLPQATNHTYNAPAYTQQQQATPVLARPVQPLPQSLPPTQNPQTFQPMRPQVAQVQIHSLPTTQQQQRRKLVLSTEGREALTKAVLSSLKDPNGVMDPKLLETAMRTTQLSKVAILNAAKMARDRETKKRRANAAALRVVAAAQPQPKVMNIIGSPQVRKTPMVISAAMQAPNLAARVHPPLMTRVHPPPSGVKATTPRMKKMPATAHSSTQSSKIIRASAQGLGNTQKSTVPKKTLAQQKSDAQAKAAAAAAVALSREFTKWRRIQHGMFTLSKNSVPGKSLRSCSLGALSRSLKTNPVLANKTTHLKSMGGAVRANIILLQNEMKQCGRIDSTAPAPLESKASSPSDVSTEMLKARRVQNSKIPLMDITEKYKRLKLQPRKESRLLEKNLRKHRQVVCDKLVKRHKELNKSIMSHSTEFYKFHRLRKIEISKFARSVRDFVAAEERKKQKGEVNEEKARLNALKANDMEAYTVLVQETRNDRLKFLLNKTDEYIDQISGLLKDQQSDEKSTNATANENDGEAETETVAAPSLLPQIEDQTSSYYETAHVRQEQVAQPSNLRGGNLKDYQVSGLQWLVSLYNNNLNGILADEMGLGKTVQTIALIAYLMETKDNRGPYLVIVPLSTLSNWVNEFLRWCPSATVIVYKGTPAQRKGLYKSEVREGHFNVLLTTYEYIIKDKSSLRKIHWEYAIVDEGHRMKNAQSKFAVTLGTQYQTKHRILLTGTPLQNSLPELWALLNFLLPSVFNSVETFDQWFNKPFAQFGTAAANDGNEEETVNTEERLLIIQRLHELLRPFMLRRIKADVLDQLPDKVEKVLRCELSSWQKELYKQISYSVLENGEKKSKRGLNNVVMQLRKVCNHPYMFTPEGYYITEDIIRTSGKFELLDRMLPKLKAAGHRILMFFQMTAAMTIMEDYLKYRNFLSLRLDGSTTGEERERRMDLFNSPNSPYFIFMLSTRAGGLGLNLVSADTVIIFDSDWNPMMDLQAQDRAHRIGQKKVVSVFRLITNSPVEEKILSRATEKLNMSELIVEAGKFDKSSVEKDTMEERQKIMEVLLIDFDTTVSKGQGTGTTGSLPTSDDEDDDVENVEKEEIDVNELLSRNDEDFEFYTKLDSGEIKDPELFESPGLLTDPDDIPDWIRYPSGRKEDSDTNEDGILEPGKRRTAATAKTYDDGLTEKQFLRIMEKQAQAEEDAAKARKLEWKEQRDKKLNANFSVDAALPSDGALSEEILNRLISMTKSIIAIRDPKSDRRYSDIFRDKPSIEEYPEYFAVVDNPIAINDIMKKCRMKQYSSASEFHVDWKLMFSNAVKFNGESSWIVADGKVLEVELNRLLQKYKVLDEPAAPPPTKKRKPRIKLSLKKFTKKRKNGDGSPSKGRKKAKTSKG